MNIEQKKKAGEIYLGINNESNEQFLREVTAAFELKKFSLKWEEETSEGLPISYYERDYPNRQITKVVEIDNDFYYLITPKHIKISFI